MNETVRIYITKDSIYCKSIQHGTKYRYCKDRGYFCVVDFITRKGLLETFIDKMPTNKLSSGERF